MGRSPSAVRLCCCPLCDGKIVSQATYKAHQKSIQDDRKLEKISEQLFNITLHDQLKPQAESFYGIGREDSLKLEELVTIAQPPLNSDTTAFAPSSSLSTTSSPMTPSPPVTDDQHIPLFKKLLQLDENLSQRIQQVQQTVDQWSGTQQRTADPASQFVSKSKADSDLKEQGIWFRDIQIRLQTTPSNGDIANFELMKAMAVRARNTVDLIDNTRATWAMQHADIAGKPDYYDTTRFFNHPIRRSNPVFVVALYISVVLSVIAHVAQQPCNFVLRMIRILMLHTASHGEQTTLQNLPTDIRTARSMFRLDPETTTFATCPTCSSVYAPIIQSGIEVYPGRCTFQRFLSSSQCNTRLTKLGVRDGRSLRVPIRPYLQQSFTAFVGGLYSRQGIEAAIRRMNKLSLVRKDIIGDINEAQAIREFRGADGKIFVESDEEIRTIWSLSYDGFNPYHNKAAGKSASVGSLAMGCLSLPPSMRYAAENIYLAGLIPGPKQPPLDGLNPFLVPLVTTLNNSYSHGTWYSQTYECPEGRRSREAVIPAIADLPGSRKLVGAAGHSATQFCSLCHLKKADINNLNRSDPAWKRVDLSEYRNKAAQWKDATSKGTRNRLYKKNGVRWSELLSLSYWDPTRYVIVDGMHTLFLGLVKHHFRVIIGMNWEESGVGEESPNEREASDLDLKRGRKVFSTNPTPQTLRKCTVPVLRALCIEYGVSDRVRTKRGKEKKKDFIAQLMASQFLNGTTPSPNAPTGQGMGLEGGLGEIEIGLDEEANLDSKEPLLLTKELEQIQIDITQTLRPTWQASPPANFGTPTHGKLKADEWRTCIDFDLPVSLVKLWTVNEAPNNNALYDRRQKMVKSTILLSMAIRWVTSHHTSALHVERYTTYMEAYLHTLRDLCPEIDLHPIHHNALHLAEFLPLFGPIHGWWMFPFERLIGMLQKINTNFKIGELEKTMLNSFCAASELRVLLQRPGCPEILKECRPIVESCFPGLQKGTLIHDINTQGPSFDVVDEPKKSMGKYMTLDEDILQALSKHTGTDVTKAREYPRYSVRGRMFASKAATPKNSVVFFQPDATKDDLIPGIIRQIFALENEDTFIALHRYSPPVSSYFDQFPDFGASIRSKNTCDQVEIIPITNRLYAANQRRWSKTEIVIRPLIEDF